MFWKLEVISSVLSRALFCLTVVIFAHRDALNLRKRFLLLFVFFFCFFNKKSEEWSKYMKTVSSDELSKKEM